MNEALADKYSPPKIGPTRFFRQARNQRDLIFPEFDRHLIFYPFTLILFAYIHFKLSKINLLFSNDIPIIIF